MLVTVHLHKIFKKHTNNAKSVTINVETYADIYRALAGLFPSFKDLLITITSRFTARESLAIVVNNNILDADLYAMPVSETKNIKIIPIFFGGGDNFVTIIVSIVAVIAIAVAAYFTFGAALAAVPGTLASAASASAAGGIAGGVAGGVAASGVATAQIVGILISVAVLGALSIAFLPPKITEKSQQANDSGVRNGLFGPLQNTIDTGTVVPLIFGEHRTSGHFISGYIKAIEHGRSDIITVREQFS